MQLRQGYSTVHHLSAFASEESRQEFPRQQIRIVLDSFIRLFLSQRPRKAQCDIAVSALPFLGFQFF